MDIQLIEEVKMKASLSKTAVKGIWSKLKKANTAFTKMYPGDRPDRQPVHTVYGGAHLFKANTAQTLGELALRSFVNYAPNCLAMATALQLDGFKKLPKKKSDQKKLLKKLSGKSKTIQKHPAKLYYDVYKRVIEKLESEAVEDFRIDFEDGFGNRSNQEEDEAAENAAKETAKGMAKNTLPPFIGIRIKPLTEEHKERSIRTLDVFLSTLTEKSSGKLPNNFVVMLPKVTIPEQAESLVAIFELLEKKLKLKSGSLQFEIMVETTQIVINHLGKNPLRQIIAASKGRCIATHFGTYDYTASNNITAKYQVMNHAVCDFAHFMTKVSLGHTGIWLSDGASNIMPVGPHKGTQLSKAQLKENRQTVHRAWKIGYDQIRHSLWKGLYQGWDLHPAQLPVRYVALYTFFLESMDDATIRLKAFMEKAAQANLSGDVFDDAATGQGLLNYFLKALNCGAITEAHVLKTGLTVEEIRLRSFSQILKKRAQGL